MSTRGAAACAFRFFLVIRLTGVNYLSSLARRLSRPLSSGIGLFSVAVDLRPVCGGYFSIREAMDPVHDLGARHTLLSAKCVDVAPADAQPLRDFFARNAFLLDPARKIPLHAGWTTNRLLGETLLGFASGHRNPSEGTARLGRWSNWRAVSTC
jgi:hypothetical protein